MDLKRIKHPSSCPSSFGVSGSMSRSYFGDGSKVALMVVLLSQCHRHQALVLLGRYLDMGTWAVEQAVSVGIFPYVLKLLQTTAPELRGILVFIWAKILALDKSCQVDLLKDGGHAYFIKCLNSSEEGTYPEQRAMASFVLAVIVDGHKRGQEACVEAGLVEVCLKYLQVLSPGDAQSEPLFLQWLCLCLGKLWKDFTKAQILGIQAGATNVISSLLMGSHPEVRASAVFALGTLVDIGFETLEDGSDEGFDDDEKLKAEISIMKSLLSVVSDGSPLVRAEVAVALARFSCGHNRHLKPLAATYLRSQPSSELSGLHVNITGSAYSTSKHYISPGTIVTSQIGPRFRVSGDSFPAISDGKTRASSPLAMGGILHGSPLSDDSSHHYDPGNGMINHAMPRPVDNALYLECIYAMCSLAKDPSPQISGLGRKVLSIIGIEQVVARPTKHSSNSSVRPIKSAESSGVRLSGLVRSLSWFDMNSGHLPLTFRTPPVSPPRSDYLSGIRRVSSLELRPNLLIPPDSGLADQPLDNGGSSSHSEHSLLPQSTIYKWSCGNFSKSLITSSDESEELSARREAKEKSALNLIAKSRHHSVGKLHCDVASWDSKFESGTKATLLQPFCPALIAADESERIRVWNCDNHALLNSFDNQEFPNKGTPKLCFLNELDDCLLLVASGNGNVRIWKDYIHKPKLVTAFCSITVHGRSTENVNVAVDWQQQSGYLFVSGYIPSIKVWDLNKEQLLHSISSDDCSTTALAASQVHESQFAAGFIDGSVRLFDIRTPDMLVCETRPHTEGVVGIGFQPGFDPAKIISASQAGDIQFLDFRNQRESCLTIINRDPPLTTFAVHRHAPVVASGSKGRVRLFSLEGDLLGQIKYHLTMFGTNIGLVSCLAFHPYQVKLAAGATDPLLTVYNACQ